jgi:hypothetical protein
MSAGMEPTNIQLNNCTSGLGWQLTKVGEFPIHNKFAQRKSVTNAGSAKVVDSFTKQNGKG